MQWPVLPVKAAGRQVTGRVTGQVTSKVMSNKMWGGRFSERPDAIMEDINVSIDVDRHLYAQDIAASRAHADMLAAQGIISASDAKNIGKGLDTILSEIGKGSFDFKRALEDIHMNVESRLGELIGPAAGRLHTARSRNDQVATDFRLYVRDTIDETDAALLRSRGAGHARDGVCRHRDARLHASADRAARDLRPSSARLCRDGRARSRPLCRCAKRLNESPLGAAALAGTSFPIDRDATAKALGFDRPMANSLDAVSDRDFVLETLAAASICAMHLSRFAEEIVVWTSPLVGLVRLSDKFTTGSSIMPQKRNPDAAELVRAKTGRIIGALTALLIVMKGLPLAYQKDMQEDKQGAMEAFAALSLAIRAMTGMVLDLVPDEARMKAAAGDGYATATDLADWLVRTLKMPFRDAHHVTGRIVARAAKDGVALHELPLKAMQEIEPKISAEALKVLSVEASVKSRTSFGGTAPKNVLAQAKAWAKRLEKQRK